VDKGGTGDRRRSAGAERVARQAASVDRHVNLTVVATQAGICSYRDARYRSCGRSEHDLRNDTEFLGHRSRPPGVAARATLPLNTTSTSVLVAATRDGTFRRCQRPAPSSLRGDIIFAVDRPPAR
jgi:hypothetical protein